MDKAQVPIANAYVGLVPVHAPWRQPIREEIGKSSVAWRVEPGSYRVVAGALGFDTVRGEVVEIGADDRALTMTLDPLASIGGSIVDASGGAVGGARIGLLGQFLEHDLRLSAKAETFLRPNALVETDDEGRFVLPVPADGSVILFVEADGFAPAIRRNMRVRTTPELPPIVLQRGASLTVSWNAAAGSDALDRLQLRPAEVQLPAELSASRALAIWTRPRVGDAQSWPSLFTGEYDLLLRTGDSDVPAHVMRIRLAAGDRKRVEVRLPEAPQEAPAAAPLRLFVRNMKRDEWRAPMLTQWIRGEASTLKGRVQTASGGLRLDATGRCVAGSTLVIATDDSIAAAQIDSESCAAPIEVVPHAAARVRMMLAPPVDGALPAAATARYPGCRDRIEIPVSIRNRELAFDAVADCGEAFVSVAGYAPIVIAPTRLIPGDAADLGVVHLTHGGSLLARVLDPHKSPAKNASVFVYRLQEFRELSGEVTLEALRPIARTTTDASGWARIAPLANEDVVLAVTPNGERVPSFEGPIVVAARQEQILDDVILPGSAEVEIAVTLASELRAIAHADSILLRGVSPIWPERAYLTAPVHAEIARLTIPAGQWEVTPILGLTEGSGLVSRPANLTVVAGVPNRITIDAGLRAYRGRVTKAGKPVAGRLVFRPAANTQGTVVNAVADDEGDFVVPLAEPGEYTATIQDASGRTFQPASPVRFSNPDLRADVRLGSRRIEGSVVDENGMLVSGAKIVAQQSQSIADALAEGNAVSGVDGRFVIDGLDGGAWAVVASNGTRRSSLRTIEVGDEPVALVLELREETDLRVAVVSPIGEPVANATVVVTPVGLPAGALVRPQVANTDERGIARFRGVERATARMLNIAVRTAAGAVTTRLHPPADEVLVAFPSAFGTLVLKRKEGEWVPGAYSRVIAEDGSWFGPRFVAVQTASDTLVAAQVPPGLWRFAEPATPAEAYALEAADLAAVRILGSAVVPAGGSAELVVEPNRPAPN